MEKTSEAGLREGHLRTTEEAAAIFGYKIHKSKLRLLSACIKSSGTLKRLRRLWEPF